MTWSGPAAATRPLFEATLRSEDVGVGSDSQGEVRRTLASPAMARKPRAYMYKDLRVNGLINTFGCRFNRKTTKGKKKKLQQIKQPSNKDIATHLGLNSFQVRACIDIPRAPIHGVVRGVESKRHCRRRLRRAPNLVYNPTRRRTWVCGAALQSAVVAGAPAGRSCAWSCRGPIRRQRPREGRGRGEESVRREDASVVLLQRTVQE